MLKNHVAEKINENLRFAPTKDQEKAVSLLANYVTKPGSRSMFLLKGYAGTGKTILISALTTTLNEMKINTVLLAPTGRAAKVLSRYANKSAFTIHKKIYRQKSMADAVGVFVMDRNLHTDTVFIVDEASMISNYSPDASVFGSGCLLDDLIEFVYSGKNCRLILIGDSAQLPPVGLDISPALDRKELRGCYNFDVEEFVLTQVVRQNEKSGILMNATKLRTMLNKGMEGFPVLSTQNYPDIYKIGGADLIEELSSAHSDYGVEDTIVISRSNKRANRFNQGIRNTVLYREEEISTGDLLMVVKNNYYWAHDLENMDFIANGDIIEIVKIRKHIEMYGFRYAEVTVRFSDYKDVELDTMIMLDALDIETASLGTENSKKLFFTIAGDYADIRSKKRRYEKVRDNKFFNALQVKFAYAVTCHKAQGGQWSAVFVDQGYLTDELLNREYYRWLYTAMTRATQKLYLVNFKKEFFPGEEEY